MLKQSLLFGVLALSLGASAKTIYLSPASAQGGIGDDTQVCELKTQPCATLARAMQVANSADVIHMAEGEYPMNTTVTIDDTVTIIGGYAADFSKKNTDAALTNIIATGGTQLFILNNNHSDYITFENLTINNTSTTVIGGFTTTDPSDPTPSGAYLRLKDTVIKNTSGTIAGNPAINMTVNGDKTEILNSTIDGYKSASGAAATMVADTELIITGSRLQNNIATTGNGGALNLAAGMIGVTVTDSTFYANNAEGATVDGGAIYLETNDVLTPVNIKLTNFIENTATRNGGAIAIEGANATTNTSVTIESATFTSNGLAATTAGGAIYHGGYGAGAPNSRVAVLNATFTDNQSVNGAAIAMIDGGETQISYSTFYDNKTANAALHADGAPTKIGLLANLVIEPTINNIIVQNSATAEDKNYNVIGTDNTPKATGLTVILGSTTYTSSTHAYQNGVADIIETTLNANGGKLKTFKLVKDSSYALNRVPNDAIPFYGVGTSEQNPFTSLAQAHGALKTYNNYAAGSYHFDLQNEYELVGSSYQLKNDYSVSTTKFTAYVNDEGWVLIASSNSSNTVATAYTKTNDMQLGTDTILNNIFIADGVGTAAGFVPSEVRVQTAEGTSAANAFDAVTTDIAVITKLIAYDRLPHDALWTVYKGSTDRLTGCAAYPVTPAKLDSTILDCDKADGLRWNVFGNGTVGFETENAATASHSANLNLWVRASGLCNGALTTIDNRGLPRSDYLNPSDSTQAGEVHHCDIGAFEFNNGYRIDCYDEDGLRPENYFNVDTAGQSASGSYQFCFNSGIINSTPQNIISNLGGSFHYLYSFILLILLYARYKERS